MLYKYVNCASAFVFQIHMHIHGLLIRFCFSYFLVGKVQVKSSEIQVGDLIIVEKVITAIYGQPCPIFYQILLELGQSNEKYIEKISF